MSDNTRFVRRNRVDERIALGLAAAAGVVAVFAGAEPTGSALIDILLVFLGVAAVAWASASAPWWAAAGAAGIAAAVSLDPIMAIIGFAAFAGGLFVGLKRRDLSESRAVIGGVAANVLIRSELELFFGLSAIIGITIGLALIVIGIRRRPRSVRRPAWTTLGVTGGIALIGLLGLFIVASAARPDVTTGADSARSGIDQLNAGDYERAAESFEQASLSFTSADDRLGGPVAAPSRLLPVVAQNVAAGRILAATAADALGEAAAALREANISALKVEGGAIDLDAVRAAEDPLLRVEGALELLRTSIADARSPWLVSRLDQELDELDADLDEEEPRLANAITAVRLAPDLLGGDEMRRYLIMFTSPAEARGLGGFVGNYAEVTISNGKISVDDFDRRSDLEAFIAENGASCAACPAEFLDRYGPFGFITGPNGGVGPRAWSNITMPAHFPYVAETAAVLYPQSGGDPIDGVFVMDPYVVAALMKFTGPIDVPELGVTVTAEDAADFILKDQYLLAFADDEPAGDQNAERIDALETLGREVITRLLTGALPDPPALVRDLAPLVTERRLLFWSEEPVEQEFLGRIGLLGALPDLDPDDGGFSVSVTNAGASKIDTYLEREVVVNIANSVANGDDGAGDRTLVADVTLRNAAPAGLPQYVTGNAVGLPTGWSRLFVTFYGPPGLDVVQQDGEDIAVSSLQEAGWLAYGTYVDIGPGATTRFHLEFDVSSNEAPENSPTVFTQPLATRI